MKHIILSILIFLPLMFFSVRAADVLIYVNADIVIGTCAVKPGKDIQDVNLGTVVNRGTNTVFPLKQFSIELTECGTASRSITVSFNGPPQAPSNEMLSIDPSGGARGVAIALYDEDKNFLPLRTASKTYVKPAGDDDFSMIFYAGYVANGEEIVPGRADSLATVELIYL